MTPRIETRGDMALIWLASTTRRALTLFTRAWLVRVPSLRLQPYRIDVRKSPARRLRPPHSAATATGGLSGWVPPPAAALLTPMEPPQEFTAMLKYDVTGVGLNLGTGEEFVRKTGMPLPAGREAEQAGVWVLGLIKARTNRWRYCSFAAPYVVS